MPRLEFLLSVDGGEPTRFFCGDLEPGEIGSLFVAALKLLEAQQEPYSILVRQIPQPELELDR